MRIDETRRNQRWAIIVDARLRMGAPQIVSLAHRHDPAAVDQNATAGRMARGRDPIKKPIARESQCLSDQQVRHEHLPFEITV